jgi:hypothetical protein
MGREEPARALECSESKIARIESGAVGMRSSELRYLLDLYQVAGRERKDLERLGAQSRKRRPRTDYGSAIPDWFRRFANLEETAVAIRSYDPEVIPGLFQTEDYARAITQASPLAPPDDIDRLVAARMARQQRLTGDDPVEVHAVLSEGVLHSQVGGAKVMQAQLRRLRELADLPNITIQVTLFECGAHAASGLPFVLLRLPDSDDLDVVYLEDATAARYIDANPEEQHKYGVIWSHLVKDALSPARSAPLLDTLVRKR